MYVAMKFVAREPTPLSTFRASRRASPSAKSTQPVTFGSLVHSGFVHQAKPPSGRCRPMIVAMSVVMRAS